ncbi:hypothetical protein ABK046_47760, partial [Streptomyces caeruleatus]
MEVAGGQAFARKGLNMICIYRPKEGEKDFISEDEDRMFLKYETYVLFQKVKPKHVGNIGSKRLYFNLKTHQYYELIDDKPFYS